MIWLIITGVLVILFILTIVLFDSNFSVTCIVLAVGCFCMGMWAPVKGYDNPIVIEEHKLMPIIEESNIYIIETEKGRKIYRCKETNKHDSTLEQNVIKEKGAEVKIEYAKEYSQPVLRKYLVKAKNSMWNGLFCEKEEYYILFASEDCVIK